MIILYIYKDKRQKKETQLWISISFNVFCDLTAELRIYLNLCRIETIKSLTVNIIIQIILFAIGKSMIYIFLTFYGLVYVFIMKRK